MIDLKMYKFNCGDIVVCPEPENYSNPSLDCYLKKPLQLIMGPSPDGKIQMLLIPWMGQSTKIQKNTIFAECDAPYPVVQEYIKLTTNIQLVS